MKNILEAVDIINDSVKNFEGTKLYLSTGDLNFSEIINLEEITFLDRPSRANQLVNTGDIILARMQDTYKVKIIEENLKDIIVSTGFLILRPKNKVSHRYLKHILSSSIFQREKDRLCSGATQKAINNTNFKKLNIPIPPVEIQEKIASILDQADRLVHLNKELIEKYDELTQSIYVKKFVENKARKNWSAEIIENLAMNKKGSMRTGPFGSDLLHSEFVNDGIAVLGIDNVVNNVFSWKERRFITKEKFLKLKRYRVAPGEVLVSIMGTVGRTAVVPEDIGVAINTKHLAAINLNREKADPHFISYSIRSNPFILEQIKRNSKGAIMSGLNLTIIKNLELKLPPLKLQEEFKNSYLNIQKQKEIASNSLFKSQELFHSLLQKAFKGELIKSTEYETA